MERAPRETWCSTRRFTTTPRRRKPTSASGCGVLSFFTAAQHNTIDSCLIYSTASTPGGYGILEGDSGTTGTVSHSEMYGTFAYAVAGARRRERARGGQLDYVYANLIDISQANNIGMAFAGSTGNIIIATVSTGR